jgi:site-specific DNA recombinase
MKQRNEMMIAAIYARKSTEQNSVADEDKSVTRQIDHAKAYAARKGWLVDDDYVYVDDGISGAEFVKRPSFIRLMNALSPRPPFQVLVMSEESRLGREQIETAYALKQITDANVRVFFYLEDRERTLDNAMDKVMLSLTNFAAEMEREKARQRTYDAMLRKAKALHVTGGKVYGYNNIEVLGTDGTRQSVTRQANPEQTAVVRRIFELYAAGTGMLTLAHRLNEEGVKPPRGRGWAPSAIREMLHRPLYRGEVVWNRSQKIVKGGTKKQRKRPESEWLTFTAPELRIIPEDLWQRVKARLAERATLFPRSQTTRKLIGRPRYQDESAYLLVGFVRCSVCGGPVGTESRAHGSNGTRQLVPHYACLDNRRRGKAICANPVALRQEILDRKILGAIAEVLQPEVLERAVEKALAKLSYARSHHASRRTQVERELEDVQRKLDRLVDALADGSLPADEIKGRLGAEKVRKTTLQAELTKLERLGGIASLDIGHLKSTLRERISDVTDLLGRHTAQARQMLRKLLVNKIELEPVGRGRERGYRFRGNLCIERLIGGEALQTSLSMVAPTGFEPVFGHGHGVWRALGPAVRSQHYVRSAAQSRSSKAARMRCRWGHQMLGWSPYDCCHTGIAKCPMTESR